jgi:hypothetical protein
MKRETSYFLVAVIVVALLFGWLFQPADRADAQPAKPATPAVTVAKLPKVQARGGEVWYNANQGTLAWDAVTQLADGSAIPAGAVIKYLVWRRVYSVSTGEKVGGEIDATQQTITFSTEGSWLVGVQAIRYIDGTPSPTEISWSDNTAVCKDGVSFGFKSFLAILQPAGLRPIQ